MKKKRKKKHRMTLSNNKEIVIILFIFTEYYVCMYTACGVNIQLSFYFLSLFIIYFPIILCIFFCLLNITQMPYWKFANFPEVTPISYQWSKLCSYVYSTLNFQQNDCYVWTLKTLKCVSNICMIVWCAVYCNKTV